MAAACQPPDSTSFCLSPPPSCFSLCVGQSSVNSICSAHHITNMGKRRKRDAKAVCGRYCHFCARAKYMWIYHVCIYVCVRVCWHDGITERARARRSSTESEKERAGRGVTVQSDAWRLNLFLTELHQCWRRRLGAAGEACTRSIKLSGSQRSCTGRISAAPGAGSSQHHISLPPRLISPKARLKFPMTSVCRCSSAASGPGPCLNTGRCRGLCVRSPLKGDVAR